jgi:general secretion pathway protein B
MSLILEALRKSESERQLGKVPGLMSPVMPVRRQYPFRRWLLLALVLLLGLGGGWWLALRLAAPPALGPAEPAVPASARAVAGDPAAPRPAEHPVSDLAAPALPTPAVAPTAPPSAAAPIAAGSVPQQAAAPTQVATPADPASAPPATPSGPAPSAAPEPAPTVATSVPLSQMPAAQRAALPSLKLSVHVFADEATRRFAIIDGRRHVEGDELGGGVRLREIQRDGVLLDIGGQPWLLERPR